jgi:hypothetical protein
MSQSVGRAPGSPDAGGHCAAYLPNSGTRFAAFRGYLGWSCFATLTFRSLPWNGHRRGACYDFWRSGDLDRECIVLRAALCRARAPEDRAPCLLRRGHRGGRACLRRKWRSVDPCDRLRPARSASQCAVAQAAPSPSGPRSGRVLSHFAKRDPTNRLQHAARAPEQRRRHLRRPRPARRLPTRKGASGVDQARIREGNDVVGGGGRSLSRTRLQPDFPANRGKYGEFSRFRACGRISGLNTDAFSGTCPGISRRPEQGSFLDRTGN